MILNPWFWVGAILLVVSSFASGYVAGGRHESNQWKAEQAKQLEAQIRERDAYLANIAEMVKKYNEKKEKARVVYRTIREEVPAVTTGDKCFNQSSVGLWNKGLAGEVVLPGTAVGAVDTPGGNGATDTDVLNNAIVNFEQYKTCRDQLNALIDWSERTFGH